MREPAKRPDVNAVLAQLKDFQRETVDHVFQRMFLDPDPAYRFLVADEVGLGKTLIARGVIARTIDHLWEKVERLDVVYICSNGDIARQNVNRLNITGRQDFAIASRITLLPIQLRDLKANKLNFVSFTPGTSFELSSAAGRATERVLLYWLLRHAWNLTGKAPLNVLQAQSSAERFRSDVDRFSQRHEIDADLASAFNTALESHIERDRAAGQADLRTRFDDLCERFGRTRMNIPREDRVDQTRLIGDLRALLAATCIRALEPDLVILDEFQRFKSLLNGEDDASLLARELFDFSSHEGRARSLLLSATPYRMYTIADGDNGEDHHRDFLDTLRFLQNDAEATRRVASGLREYRQTLCLLSNGSEQLLQSHKETLESELRRVIVRTERLAASEDRNGMLTEVAASIPALETRDVMTYRSLQRIARALEHHDTLDYWKAAPYVLSFMDDYKLKRQLTTTIEHEPNAAVVDIIANDDSLCLPADVISGKGQLNPPHARVKWLIDEAVNTGAWRLLWLPPSLSYYTPGGAFADPSAARVTKRLIFSAWRIVPKALASLVSYEAERQMLASFGERGDSLADVRQKLVPLLRFGRTDDRLTGMPVLGLLYPSIYLAEVGDPLKVRAEFGADDRLPSCEDLLARVREKIAAKLEPILDRHAAATGPVDESWYWAAPLLLDRQYSDTLTQFWFGQHNVAALWSGQDPENPDTEHGPWAEHVARARSVLRGREMFGVPPDDLATVLAQLAVASPAVTALRSLARVTGGVGVVSEDTVRNYAGQIAWGFRNLFNLPESIAVVRGLNAEEPYWRRVLEYCLDGNLQAVLDEYVHVLKEASGLFGGTPSEIAQGIAKEFRGALGLRTSTLGVDDIKAKRGGHISIERPRMRTRFALRFGDDETEGEGDRTRTDLVRGAFNSPFWPFVLATTAVGQEGLDFHLYCHAVVHWNLPSNPVDLEQREGRVHRYKGHAVRKNLARRYSAIPCGDRDPWAEIFERACDDRAESSTDLVPYWIYPVEGGARIERQIPAFPLSRELGQLSALRRTLAVYRMVFGQPRQDELLEYLLTQMSHAQAVERLDQMKIDLSPRRPNAERAAVQDRRVVSDWAAPGSQESHVGLDQHP